MCDQDRFFIFEDQVLSVLLALTRDPALSWGAALQPHPLCAGLGRRNESHGLYPPSGLLPFRGLGGFVAPLCYLLEEPADVYTVAKRLYQELFCRLHTLSAVDEPLEYTGSLLSLAGTCTRLVADADPVLTAHLEGLGEGASPLELAFPWIASTFVDALEIDQLFLLWDRVIGFSSLMPLAVLAAGVLLVKRDLLMLATTPAEAKEVTRDLSRINVSALLQATLFGPLKAVSSVKAAVGATGRSLAGLAAGLEAMSLQGKAQAAAGGGRAEQVGGSSRTSSTAKLLFS